MREYQIICIDDDEQFLASLANCLPAKVEPLCSQFRCVFDFVASPKELFKVLSSRAEGAPSPAMIISDQVMPQTSGLALIERLKADHPDLVCVLLTGYAGLDSAKYAINRRLLDQYVSKPIADLQEFAALVANLLRGHHLDLEERQRTAELAQKIEELRLSNDKIRAMHAAAEQVAMLSKNLKSLDFDEVVDLVTREVPRLFHARWSVLCFQEHACPAQSIRRQDCACPEDELRARQDAGQSVGTGEVFCGQIAEVCQKIGGQSPELIIPLAVSNLSPEGGKTDGQWHGYLCMCRVDPGLLGSPDLLTYMGGLVRDILSANLTNARLYQEARRQSQTDLLTGASTRRVLEERLEAEGDRAARYGRPFCVAIVDVDHFKGINDQYGHAAGDEILKHLSAMLEREVRSTDLLARYGGDEFVILMPETQLDDALTAVERMRRQAETILTPAAKPLSISCGLAQWSPAASESATSVLRHADTALYQAKRGGRNRVEVAQAA